MPPSSRLIQRCAVRSWISAAAAISVAFSFNCHKPITSNQSRGRILDLPQNNFSNCRRRCLSQYGGRRVFLARLFCNGSLLSSKIELVQSDLRGKQGAVAKQPCQKNSPSPVLREATSTAIGKVILRQVQDAAPRLVAGDRLVAIEAERHRNCRRC